MAIQFESIQDPFGIATGGTILGKMLQEQNQQARSIAAQKEIKLADIMGQKEIQASEQQGTLNLENAKRSREMSYSPIVGQALAETAGLPLDQQVKILGKYSGSLPPEIITEIYKTMTSAATKQPAFEKEGDKLQAQNSAAYWTDLSNKHETSYETIAELERSKELNKKGTLPSTFTAFVYDRLKLPIGLMNNPDATEQAKITSTLMNNVSAVFPGAVKVAEMDSYGKTLPSLLNDPKGQERVIDLLLALEEGKNIKYLAGKQIIKENGGMIPSNFQMMVNDASEEKLKVLKDRVVAGITGSISQEKTPAKEFESLPDAKSFGRDHPGRTITNTETGEKMVVQNGQWVKQG